MQFGVLGTGVVGQTLASKLVEVGHEVKMGSRQADGETALGWVKRAGTRASQGTFADAATFGQIVINATSGANSLSALEMAGEGNLVGKVIIDVANPLDFSNGFPPQLTVTNTDSLGERIQAAFPQSHVVKTLNTVNAMIMVNPGSLSTSTNIFICANDSFAKREVLNVLNSFGWADTDVIDLGDLKSARATEGFLPLWVNIFQSIANPSFNIKIVKG